MKNKPFLTTISVVVIIGLFTGVYMLLNVILNKNDEQKKEEIFLKNYEVNEYIPTYVSDEDMARIYLNDYINKMYYDIESAYNLLNEEYRNKKFGSLENYKNYVKSLNYSSYNLARYYKKNIDGNIIFGVYDENNNFFGFKTNGVMQYTVYLDDYTVEM